MIVLYFFFRNTTGEDKRKDEVPQFSQFENSIP